MRALTEFAIDADARGSVTLAFGGPMRISSLGLVDRPLRRLNGPINEVDLDGVREIDTVGACTAWRIARVHQAPIVNAREDALRLIAAVGAAENAAPIRLPPKTCLNWVLEALGALVSGWGQRAKDVVSFLGAVLIAAGAVIRHPRRFRTKALVHQIELVGVSSCHF
jgi:phospholipid/cholesterol/gamma-HCH transport system permease protein